MNKLSTRPALTQSACNSCQEEAGIMGYTFTSDKQMLLHTEGTLWKQIQETSRTSNWTGLDGFPEEGPESQPT